MFEDKKNFKMHKDAELIFYNLDAIKDTEEVIIVEGEMDCLSFIEAGLDYCVSVPNGANVNFEYINNSHEYFANKKKIYICVDNDEAGIKLKEQLTRRFGKDICYYIEFPFKDANELLIKTDISELIYYYNNAKSIPLDDVSYLHDLREAMIYEFNHGKPKGTTTYFQSLDPHFKWKKGDVTLFHGIGNHGKTAFVHQLCLIKSIMDGDKWGIYSPEMYPANEFYDDLIHTFLGKNIDPQYSNQCTQKEYENAMDFIQQHFFYIYPETACPTPEFINKKFKELILKEGITGGVIDPFNQLDNDIAGFGRDDLYISHFLTGEKRFALKHDFYKIIIAHPKNLMHNGKKSAYDCPRVFDLHGGAMWNNKCDNIIAYHRPNYYENPLDATCEIHIQKIKKQKIVGIPGTISLHYDRVTARYYDCSTSPFVRDTNNVIQFANFTKKEEKK